MASDLCGEAQSCPLMRRQRELTSLYATAKSLTALGELDDVLRTIVHNAHDLIGTDFTYLSLAGPDSRHQNDLELQLGLRLHQLKTTATAPS